MGNKITAIKGVAGGAASRKDQRKVNETWIKFQIYAVSQANIFNQSGDESFQPTNTQLKMRAGEDEATVSVRSSHDSVCRRMLTRLTNVELRDTVTVSNSSLLSFGAKVSCACHR